MSLEEGLFGIEEGFWLRGREHFQEHVDEKCLLVFPQMGQMHGVRSRDEVAATATNANRWRDLKVTNRHILQPNEGTAVISYRADVTRADGQPYSALVSSVYVRRAGGWEARISSTLACLILTVTV